MTLEIPDAGIVTVPEADLPDHWNKKGYHDNVQQCGTKWVQSLLPLAIVLPSVTSPDYNVLVNPSHPEFGSVIITKADQLRWMTD